MTPRQRGLHDAVRRAASGLDEQLLIVGVLATRLGCSSADIEAVRDLLLTPPDSQPEHDGIRLGDRW